MGVKTYLKTVGLKGLIQVLKSKFTTINPEFKTSRGDCMHPFWLRLNSSDIHTCKQIFIYKEYDFKIKTEPKVIIDAGANIGLASIFFANRYPAAKIIAIEPEKSNYDLLTRNTKAYPNIITLEAALWNKDTQIDLVDPGRGKWGFITEENNGPDHNKNVCNTVTAVTIDTLIEKYNLDNIDILKIDIEGAEKEVFSDTKSWINKVRSIIIELHEGNKAGCNRSFYCGTNGFDHEWKNGENICLSRDNYISPL